MRLPNAVHESRPWRIREIAPDFTLEDVWALPVYGGAGDFPALLEVMTSRDLAREASPVTRRSSVAGISRRISSPPASGLRPKLRAPADANPARRGCVR